MGNFIMRPDGTFYEEPDILAFARWFETAERHVADDTINGIRVSTVFLGIDHNHRQNGPPILFETLTFGTDDNNELQRRYYTRDEALLGHLEVMNQVKQWASMMKKGPSPADATSP